MKSYVNNINPYKITSHDIWDMDENKRRECLKLDWNEATIPPSPHVIARLNTLVSKGDFYQWYPNTDNTRLITSISKYIGVERENVQIFSSSDTLHEYIVRCWLRNRDKVLILWPTYDNFRATAEIAGTQILYSTSQDIKFDAGMLQKNIELYNPRLVYICNPNNPTGEQISISIIEDLIRKNNAQLFLIDEAYAEFSRETAIGLIDKYDNLLVSRTFSKAFALANFRVGYLVSCKSNIAAISKIRNSKNITTLSQEAAIAALDDLEYMRKYVTDVQTAREFFQKELEKVDFLAVYPSRANFVLIKLIDQRIKHKFLNYMKSNHIYIRDLQQDVLKECYVRITIGTMEQMKIVLQKIKQFGDCNCESSIV